VYDRVFVSDAEETIIALTIVELSRPSVRFTSMKRNRDSTHKTRRTMIMIEPVKGYTVLFRVESHLLRYYSHFHLLSVVFFFSWEYVTITLISTPLKRFYRSLVPCDMIM